MALFKRFKKNYFNRFCRDENGNFGVLGSASVLALLLISGLTIDTMNLTQAAAELQSVTDAGVVAASADTTLSLSERNDIFQQVIDAHALQNRSLQDIEFDLSVDATSPEEINVSVFSSAEVPLLFAEYFGKKSEVVAVSGGKADNV